MHYLFYLLFAYVSLSVFLRFYQDRLIFFPNTLTPDYPFREFPDATERFFYPENGVTIHALHFKVNHPKGIVLYFHGNARAIDQWGYMARIFTQMEFEVVMPDYRGFGKSTGIRTEAKMIADGNFVYRELLKTHEEADLILYGRSMGSGVTTAVATTTNPRLLILETPYHSIYRLANESPMRFFPVNWVLKYHFRSDLRLPQVTCPVFLFHGTEDELIPYRHAVDLAAVSPAAKLITIEGGGHNNLEDFETFRKALQKVLLTESV